MENIANSNTITNTECKLQLIKPFRNIFEQRYRNTESKVWICGIIDNVFHTTSSPFGSIYQDGGFLPGGIGPCKTNNSLSRTILPLPNILKLEMPRISKYILRSEQIHLWKMWQITNYQEPHYPCQTSSNWKCKIFPRQNKIIAKWQNCQIILLKWKMWFMFLKI